MGSICTKQEMIMLHKDEISTNIIKPIDTDNPIVDIETKYEKIRTSIDLKDRNVEALIDNLLNNEYYSETENVKHEEIITNNPEFQHHRASHLTIDSLSSSDSFESRSASFVKKQSLKSSLSFPEIYESEKEWQLPHIFSSHSIALDLDVERTAPRERFFHLTHQNEALSFLHLVFGTNGVIREPLDNTYETNEKAIVADLIPEKISQTEVISGSQDIGIINIQPMHSFHNTNNDRLCNDSKQARMSMKFYRSKNVQQLKDHKFHLFPSKVVLKRHLIKLRNAADHIISFLKARNSGKIKVIGSSKFKTIYVKPTF